MVTAMGGERSSAMEVRILPCARAACTGMRRALRSAAGRMTTTNDVRDGLRPGMTATAVVTTKTKPNVLAVPLQAVIEKPAPTPAPGATPQGSTPAPAPGGEKPKDIKGVYILQGNKVKFVQVETGITGESDIEITSGLQPGVEVITGPSRVLRTLKDNATVKKQTRKPGEGNANASEAK